MAAPILNDRDLALQASLYRFATTLVSISASAGAFKTFKNGGTTAPANIVLTATPNIVFTAAAVYAWSYALSTAPAVWVALGSGNTTTVTNTNILTIVGEATWVQYRCLVTENLLTSASGFFTVTYSKEVSEPIIVDITRAAAVIASNSAGEPTGYTNTDTTISVSRGDVALAYNALGGINSFKVDIQADNVARTVGTINTTATTYGISGITNITVDIATVIFVVTVYDASGVIVSPTFAKRITYTKVTNGVIGGDATFSYIEASSPVISKSTSAAPITGTHSNVTVTGKRVIGSAAPATYGFLTVTGNGDAEATLATANSITTAINNTAGKTSYTVKLYNQTTVAGAILLDSDIIPVLFTGSSAIIAALTNDSATIPTNSVGTAGIYTGTPTEIHVYEGATELTYDAVGTASGTWKIASTFQSNITIGAITDSGLFATTGNASNITGNTALISYTISGVSLGGVAFSLLKTQAFSIAYAGATGSTGTSGTKSITISAFRWGTSIGTFAQAATYTWGGNVSAYPVGWTAGAQASTANGETLFQINLTITAIATDTTTAVNWSSAVSNTIGYRLDGSIGIQGNSARVAYIVTTSGTPPVTPTALAGDQAPTGWSFISTSVLANGQFMYQSDGILTTGGNIAWGNPYLSNLKVGSLSAISATLGVVTAGTISASSFATGAYSSYNWPAANAGGGSFLNSSGLLLGNQNAHAAGVVGAGYFQVTSGGDIYSPGLSVVGGAATFSGSLNVKSAASGARMEIKNNVIKVFDSAGTLRVQLGDLTV